MSEDEASETDNLNLSGVWGDSDFSADDPDSSFVSIPSNPSSAPSTPKKFSMPKPVPNKSKIKHAASSVFKQPTAPPFGTCTMCRKVLKTANGFNNHMLSHKMKDAAKDFGSLENVLLNLRNEIPHVISKLLLITKNVKLLKIISQLKSEDCLRSAEWVSFIEEVFDIIKTGLEMKGASTIMPQALRSKLLQTVNSCLCNRQLCDKLFEKFNLVVSCALDVFSLFIFDCLWECVDRCVLFVCKSMQMTFRAPNSNLVSPKDDGGYKIAQLIHHIAGFAFYHTVSHAKRYPKNEKLQRMRECILAQFAERGVPPVLDGKEVAYWTHVLNRKCLMFVADRAFPFFSKLGCVLLASEERDGSVLLEKVCMNVVSDPTLLVMWDAIVQNCLSESESFDLLFKIVTVIARTYGRGSMLKKMNMISKNTKSNKKTLSISHRAGLL